MSKRKFQSPGTPAARTRSRTQLIQGSPQSVASDHPVEDVIEEVMDEAEEAAEAIDIADGDGPAAAIDHIIREDVEMDLNTHRLHRFAHVRGRHFLPLQPGILTC